MKNLILITLLFIVFQGKAQTTKPIDGFLGVKFGSTPAAATQALKLKGAKPDLAYNAKYAKSKELEFNHVTVGSKTADGLFVKFVDDKAYEALFVFTAEFESKTIEFYDSLVADINSAYGFRGSVVKSFTKPYEDGDGYEITALKGGNADYNTNWNVGDNYITAQISPDKDGDLVVSLFYTDGKLEAIAKEKEKAKSNSEF